MVKGRGPPLLPKCCVGSCQIFKVIWRLEENLTSANWVSVTLLIDTVHWNASYAMQKYYPTAASAREHFFLCLLLPAQVMSAVICWSKGKLCNHLCSSQCVCSWQFQLQSIHPVAAETYVSSLTDRSGLLLLVVCLFSGAGRLPRSYRRYWYSYLTFLWVKLQARPHISSTWWPLCLGRITCNPVISLHLMCRYYVTFNLTVNFILLQKTVMYIEFRNELTWTKKWMWNRNVNQLLPLSTFKDINRSTKSAPSIWQL